MATDLPETICPIYPYVAESPSEDIKQVQLGKDNMIFRHVKNFYI